jgi:hypothetical protein
MGWAWELDPPKEDEVSALGQEEKRDSERVNLMAFPFVRLCA